MSRYNQVVDARILELLHQPGVDLLQRLAHRRVALLHLVELGQEVLHRAQHDDAVLVHQVARHVHAATAAAQVAARLVLAVGQHEVLEEKGLEEARVIADARHGRRHLQNYLELFRFVSNKLELFQINSNYLELFQIN